MPKVAPDVVTLDYRLKVSQSGSDSKTDQLSFPGTPILILSELKWIPWEINPYATAFVSKGKRES